MREKQVQRGQEWLETLLRLMGLPTEVTVKEEPNNQVESSAWLILDETRLTPQQIEILIGSEGKVIDAIQYLTNTLVNLGLDQENQQRFMVELHGYRRQRQAELLSWVQEVAQKVRQTGKEVEMKSLSSAERLQIHTFLQDSPDLETESRGLEPDRRLVVKLR